LSNAFDTIDHKILINKLEYCGVRGQSLDWFKGYLSDRIKSGPYSIYLIIYMYHVRGTTECVLGPLFFIIYSNGVTLSFTYTRAILFADDTKLYAFSKQPDKLYHKIHDDTNYMFFPVWECSC